MPANEYPSGYSEQGINELKSHFDAALGQGGPLMRSLLSPSYFERMGFGLSYCFEYEQDRGRQYYEAIQELVRRYHGAFPWLSILEFNAKGACVAFTPPNLTRAGRSLSFVHFQELLQDAHRLCDYFAQNLERPEPPLGLKRGATGSTSLSDRDDAEGGPFSIYVLANPGAGIHGPLQATDRKLHFGPTDDEWKDLMSALREASPGSLSTGDRSNVEGPISGLPLLSRLASPYYEAIYNAMELDALNQECDLSLRVVGERVARSAINKIQLAIRWAQASNSGLLFGPTI